MLGAIRNFALEDVGEKCNPRSSATMTTSIITVLASVLRTRSCCSPRQSQCFAHPTQRAYKVAKVGSASSPRRVPPGSSRHRTRNRNHLHRPRSTKPLGRLCAVGQPFVRLAETPVNSSCWRALSPDPCAPRAEGSQHQAPPPEEAPPSTEGQVYRPDDPLLRPCELTSHQSQGSVGDLAADRPVRSRLDVTYTATTGRGGSG